ncbi:MAG: ATP-binding cassette domain-containing protein [Alphaproteobacteria bacterium]|nr:ATP-binding cassette domain-containing protein [Alphaproteobacteria bacterium]
MFRLLESLIDPFRATNDAPPDRFWPFILGHLRPFRRLLAVVAVTGFCVATIETGLIFYAGRLVDLMTASGLDHLTMRHGVELAVVALLILLVRPIVIVLNIALLNQGLSVNLLDQVRWRAHKHLLGQSVGFFHNDFAGRIANRVMQTGPAVEDSTYMAFEALWYAAAYILGATLVLVNADERLIVPLALWLVAYLLLLRVLIPRIGHASMRLSDARSLVTGRIVDAYTNIQTVKLFAHAAREEAYAQTAMRMHRLRLARLMRLMTTMTAGLATLNGVLIVSTVGGAVWLWHVGETTLGVVAAAAALTLRLNGMTGWIMWVLSQLFQYAGMIKEGMETISEPHEIVDAPDAPALNVSGGAIRFHDVEHLYRGRTNRTTAGGLRGVDLDIRPGERVGLVGRSGAGKSTLINLLLRFYDIECGRIEIDGQDISRVSQESLRRSIAVVTQDTALLHRSVRDNILYGRPDATEAEMREAARLVYADEFIGHLEDPKERRGYDAHVGERGVKLSGGQRQRIALARAVLKDAPILILDEATSALDSEAEALIQAALGTLMAGKTVIAIAHRLSTIQRMDRIIVLDQGRIVEQGTHAELLERRGLYEIFWSRQSGGFIGIEPEQSERPVETRAG